MRTPLCDQLGIDVPICGFTPSPEVAAAISRAGGLGVLGAIRYTHPDELAEALDWMDAHVDGRPYGVDVVMPQSSAAGSIADAEAMIPAQHRVFVETLLAERGVPDLPPEQQARAITGWMDSHARSQVAVALEHPIALLANALGSPPADVVAAAHAKGILVAALAGKAVHARKHAAAGLDIVVAQGHEAGGHCGEITTMVLVPEVVDAVAPVPVLAAGGIATGRQLAAALALGAQGVWLGSVWLTAAEYQLEPASPTGNSLVKEKLLAASSSDTVRSRVISGKPARMLKTPWTESWTAEGSPGTLPMPLQGMLVAEAEARIRAVQHPDFLGTPVGQVVGQMNAVQPVAVIIERLMAEADACLARLDTLRGG